MKQSQSRRYLETGFCVLSLGFSISARALAQEFTHVVAPNYADERADRARDLSRPYGWMSLVALKALHPGSTTVGSSNDNDLVLAHAPPHLLQVDEKDGRLSIVNADGSVRYHGKSVNNETVAATGEDDNSALASGNIRMWVIKRGDQLFLRVKDSEAPALRHFHGLRWYPPKEKYRVSALWIPDAAGHRLQIINKLGQLSETSVPGHVEFELDGKKSSLVPIEASANSLWFVFRDETYKADTDQGGRFLTVKSPATGIKQAGFLQLDFNEATNPPCAYSPYATCPLAPKENRLSIAIPAGEKRYDP